MHYDYKTSGTCSRVIHFDIDGDKISNISFDGGCNGNLKGISILANGLTVEQIEKAFSGLTCGLKPTSCPDQLARAVRKAYNEVNSGKLI
ncbi:MAG: TIGR03905 family TSCPD domain-containing protein [bacterium]|jgi:uncharacterized protein (TIGR03905 family)|nr:TIGR03905 family TSCPD domain-containing protein [bacterium]